MPTDPTARALLLLSLLQARAGWTVEELAERLEVSGRTVRRDAERLRGLGYGIEARPGPGSSYRLVPGVKVPPLLFDPDEITAVVTGLHLLTAQMPGDDAPARALAKLGQILPPALRRRAAATSLATEVGRGDQPGIEARTIGVLADAVAAGSRVRFGYVDQRGRATTRRIAPFRHIHHRGRWYLIGYDTELEDWRTFRLDRVRDAAPVPGRYRSPDFPEESIEHWFATDFGREEMR